MSEAQQKEKARGLELLTGTIERVTYRNAENDFGVLKVLPEDSSINLREITVIGTVPHNFGPGIFITAHGKWVTHDKFGEQFRAYSITERRPTEKEAIIRYLSSKSVRGFGPVLAERVVEKFGERTLEILDKNPNELLSVSGIGKRKLEEIIETWQPASNKREVMLFFEQHDISHSLAERIYRRFGDKSIDVISENPYLLTEEIWGIGFNTADTIAHQIGISLDSDMRVGAGIVHTLKKAADDGHVFLPKEKLIERSAAILSLQDFALVAEVVQRLISEAKLIGTDESLYLPNLFEAEQLVSAWICKRIASSADITPLPEKLVTEHVTGSIDQHDSGGSSKSIRLSEQQQEAVSLCASRPLLVLTGGPGCGKTTVVRAISALFRSAGLTTKLAAPTGRASQRLAEVCGFEASTIHRLLGVDPSSRDFVHNSNEPLELDAIIVDEASMVDLELAASLFQAIPKHARVVIVGDADQLPSVGPGRVLSDLLKIENLPSIRLTRLFRREAHSSINEVAHQINTGAIPNIPQPDGQTSSDVYFVPGNEAVRAAKIVESLVSDQLPKKFNIKPAEITVLTPMNQGELGVKALNNRLQEKLLPPTLGMPSVSFGALQFRLGDRVCQRVNNYNICDGGVFNGDQGKVVGIDSVKHSLTVELWDGRHVTYKKENLRELDLAYALTIHRSQGSEMRVVVMVLHDAHSIMLERQLVYTGITRAKQLLVIVGTRRAIILSSKRSRSSRRYTALPQLVEAKLKEES